MIGYPALLYKTTILKWSATLLYSTSRKVAGSISDGVIGIFHYSPGVDSVSNRNEYQEYFLGVKAAGA